MDKATRLDEIRARCEAATPGPWESSLGDIFFGEYMLYVECAGTNEDSEFIAHAREDIPFLLGEAERMQKVIIAAAEACDAVNSINDALRRERDAAVQDARLNADLDSACITCRFFLDDCCYAHEISGADDCDWQWRGPQEVKTDE